MKIGYFMQAGVPDIRQKPLSGPAIHVKHVFDELINLGHQLRLLAVIKGRIWKSDDLESFEPVTVKRIDKGLFRQFEKVIRRIQFELKLPYAALFESVRFAQACRQELAGYDLFYERMGWMGYGGAIASRWLGIPLILEVNGDHLSEMEMLGNAPQGMQRWLSTMITQVAVRQAAGVVATGEGWRNKFIERWDIEPAKVTVVDNGSALVDLLQREQLRSFLQTGGRNEAVNVVYVGAFEPWHGIPILLKAVAKVIAQDMLLQVVLIGSGSELDRIKKLIGDLKLEEIVTLTGQLGAQQYALYLAEADIGVSPYCGRYEYSGLKLLDYMAAGLATIASGENGQPAVLEHGRTGWIVPPCDENTLCEAIVYLTKNPNLRRKIGQAARIEAEQCHSWRSSAEQLSELFGEVLNS